MGYIVLACLMFTCFSCV